MIRYKKLGYVELLCTDQARSRDFYENLLGLQYVGQGPYGEAQFRCGDDPFSLSLHQSDKSGHKRTGYMLEGVEQFDNLHARLKEKGVPFEQLSQTELQERKLLQATRLVEPATKAVLEFYVNDDGGGAHYKFTPTLAKIKQLGHVVYATPHFDEAVDFYLNVLNFAESDTIEGVFTFMRPWPNPFHHGIGIGRGKTTLYHHTNFMVSEIDDIGKAIHRLTKAGVPIVHGPGKHVASSSVFLYFLDPDGVTCEYSYGMEEFHEDFGRKARTLPLRPGIGDSWGAPLDPRMAAHGDIETLTIA